MIFRYEPSVFDDSQIKGAEKQILAR